MTPPGLVSVLLFAPVAAAAFIFFLPSRAVRAIRAVSLAAASVSLAAALWVFAAYDRAAGGYQFVDKAAWAPSLGIDYHAGVDGISAVLVLLTALCSFSGVMAAFSVRERVKEYFIFYLFLIAGCFGVLVSLNVFFMYFFYETAVIPVFPLIGAWGSGRKEYASMKLTLYLTFGAVLALLAILALYWQAGLGTFNFVVLENVLAANPLPPDFQKWAFPLIMVGFGVILTLWPFHTWSPIGYAAAPTSVSMLHAGVLKKLGAYLIIRLGITLMPYGARVWMPVVATLAAVNIVYCGLVAFTQKDLKYILGYSSCSHMGLILLGLAAMTPTALEGVVFYMFAHGVMAALGFALVGFIYEQTHTRELGDWGGLGKKVPFVATVFVMAALASSGVPGFANFIGEILILIGAWERYPIQTLCAAAGLVITAGYMLKTVRAAFQGPINPRCAEVRDAAGAGRIPYALLAGVLLFAGLLPVTLLGTISSGTDNVLKRSRATGLPVITVKIERTRHGP